jgi:hypothetical protein
VKAGILWPALPGRAAERAARWLGLARLAFRVGERQERGREQVTGDPARLG